MQGFAQPEDPSLSLAAQEDAARAQGMPNVHALGEDELEAALQLLVERAQYITGATGAALALPHAGEMVCRASAGSCAPAVGASLQVRSGLTGESITRRALLRCDNAESDPRVNLETCRALGIASIVVLPLLRASGEVRGLFELFSDHPYAFEERDLVALERMAGLTTTALDLAEQRHGSIPPPPPVRQPEKFSAPPGVAASQASIGTVVPEFAPEPIQRPSGVLPSPAEIVASPSTTQEVAAAHSAAPVGEPASESTQPLDLESALIEVLSPPTPVPESMRRVRKCSACGFPISEGRTVCLDCEKKQGDRMPAIALVEGATALAPAEDLPPFLANAAPIKESWLSNHVNLLAIVVLVLVVLVAIVVFR